MKENRNLWVDVLKDNCNPTKGLSMQYMTPTIVAREIEIDIEEEEDVVSELKFWEMSLIMYVLGGDLSMNTLNHFIERVWNFIKLPDMYYHEERYFILKFQSHKDMDSTMMNGPYMIHNMSMLLKEWKPGFNLRNDMLRTLPIWIKLPNMPLHLWGEKSRRDRKCNRKSFDY